MHDSFSVRTFNVEGPKVITPFFSEDNRGFFLKYYEKNVFEKLGIHGITSEDFLSYSVHGVIRGLHFQIEAPQQKIVHVITGTVRDVIVDLRKQSPSFGKHIAVDLSDKNHKILYVPGGFAHGFEVLSDYAIMSYKCIGEYINSSDTGILYNSPELSIHWETQNPILSEKDLRLMSFSAFYNRFGGLSS